MRSSATTTKSTHKTTQRRSVQQQNWITNKNEILPPHSMVRRYTVSYSYATGNSSRTWCIFGRLAGSASQQCVNKFHILSSNPRLMISWPSGLSGLSPLCILISTSGVRLICEKGGWPVMICQNTESSARLRENHVRNRNRTSSTVIENENTSDAGLKTPGEEHSSGANHLYESETPRLWVNGTPVKSSMICKRRSDQWTRARIYHWTVVPSTNWNRSRVDCPHYWSECFVL